MQPLQWKGRGLNSGARKSPALRGWQLSMSELNSDPAASCTANAYKAGLRLSWHGNTWHTRAKTVRVWHLSASLYLSCSARTNWFGHSCSFYWHTVRNSFRQNHFILQFSHSCGSFKAVNGVFQEGQARGLGWWVSASLRHFFKSFYFLAAAMLNVKKSIHNTLTPQPCYLSHGRTII